MPHSVPESPAAVDAPPVAAEHAGTIAAPLGTPAAAASAHGHTSRQVVVPLALFGATFVSTALSGVMQTPAIQDAASFGAIAWACVVNIRLGLPYAFALMAILVAHEAGHALAARRHGVPASLPYFIPLPFTTLGTMGAVIGLRAEVPTRNALLDIAAAGPLAGMAVALPILAYGIHVSAVGPTHAGDLVEGQSLLYLGLKLLLKGEVLPSGGRDLQLGPVAFAGWVGLLVTVINLMPIGPLDGGHVAAAALGRGHDRRSRFVHRLLPMIGGLVALYFAVRAIAAGLGIAAAASAARAGLPWIVWTGVLLLLRKLQGGYWHEPLGHDVLTPRRAGIAVFVAVLYVLLFMPWVMREVP